MVNAKDWCSLWPAVEWLHSLSISPFPVSHCLCSRFSPSSQRFKISRAPNTSEEKNEEKKSIPLMTYFLRRGWERKRRRSSPHLPIQIDWFPLAPASFRWICCFSPGQISFQRGWERKRERERPLSHTQMCGLNSARWSLILWWGGGPKGGQPGQKMEQSSSNTEEWP